MSDIDELTSEIEVVWSTKFYPQLEFAGEVNSLISSWEQEESEDDLSEAEKCGWKKHGRTFYFENKGRIRFVYENWKIFISLGWHTTQRILENWKNLLFIDHDLQEKDDWHSFSLVDMDNWKLLIENWIKVLYIDEKKNTIKYINSIWKEKLLVFEK